MGAADDARPRARARRAGRRARPARRPLRPPDDAVAALLPQQKAGWIIARLTSDVDALSDVLSQGLTTLVVNTLTLIAAIIGLFILDWRLGLVALVILPPTLVLTRWFQVRSHAAFLRVRETISSMTAQIAESVSGMAVIQAFNRERAFLDEFDRANDANRARTPTRNGSTRCSSPGSSSSGSSRWRPSSGSAVGCSTHGSLTIGTLVSSVFLLNLVFQPLQELSDLYGQVQSAGAAMEKITTVLDTEAEIRDRRGARKPDRIEGDLHIDDVTFSYGREPRAARDRHPCARRAAASRSSASRAAASRRRRSSSGASTTPTRARSSSTGTTFARSSCASYRRQLGVVLQDPFLFAGTIADNIRFARPEATDERSRTSPRAVGVDRVARRFDEGLEHRCARAARDSRRASAS